MKQMYNKINLWIAIALIGVVVTACNTGQKMLQKGNYYEAVMKSVDKLRSSPDNKKARATLADAYPYAVSNLLDKIESQKAARSQFQHTETVYVYEDLNRMYDNIQRCPAAKQIIPNPNKYFGALADAKPKAAQEQYAAGQKQLSLGTRDNAKQAYFYFKKSNKFVAGFKDVNAKIEEAYNLSILKVLVDLVPVQSRRYNLSADLFYDEVDKVLRKIEGNEFIRFLTPQQAQKRNLNNPDQILSINFEDFVVGETHTTERIEKLQSDSVKVSTITLDDGTKREVFDIVKAELTVMKMEVISKGLINLTITHGGYDNKTLLKEDFAGQFVWISEWGNFNGDERALTKEQLAICKAKQARPIPPQQMFLEFTKPIHAQLRTKLINFYNGY